jgi:hypothetical protein
MADKKISELPLDTAIDGTESFAAIDGISPSNVTKRIPISLFAAGVLEYNAGFTYQIGYLARDPGTTILYKSLTNSNTGNALTDVVNWELVGDLEGIKQATETQQGTLEIATDAEVIAETADDKAITPLKLANRLGTAALEDTGATNGDVPLIGVGDKLSTALIDTGTTNGQVALVGAGDKLDNTIINDSSETTKGIAEIATLAETNTGTDDTRTLTPNKLANGKWGAMVLLSTSTASNDANIDINNIDGTYSQYVVELINIVSQNDDVDFRLRVSEDNGATFESGASDYNWVITGSSSDNKDPADNNNASDYIAIGGVIGGGKGQGNAIGESYSGKIIINNPSSTNTFKNFGIKATFTNTNGFVMMIDNAGSYFATQNAINAVRFFFSSGNIVSGTFKLYGIK